MTCSPRAPGILALCVTLDCQTVLILQQLEGQQRLRDELGPHDHLYMRTRQSCLDHLLTSAGVDVPVIEHAGLLENRALLDSIKRRILHCTGTISFLELDLGSCSTNIPITTSAAGIGVDLRRKQAAELH